MLVPWKAQIVKFSGAPGTKVNNGPPAVWRGGNRQDGVEGLGVLFILTQPSPNNCPQASWTLHSFTPTPAALRDPGISAQHSQDTLSLTVLSTVTPAPDRVTRQVRSVPWWCGSGVRVSTEEWGALKSSDVRETSIQEKEETSPSYKHMTR